MTGPTADRRPTTDGASGSPVRGFLFADLRGYTAYVETAGATRASELLDRYRSMVRTAVHQFRGAEVKTEGDSFYVVFDAVSAAVGCGLEIVRGAGTESSEHPEAPIRVGVGIHAGETVQTEAGYVGTAVNVAARLCAVAEPGEVLVSDTVRSLTQAVLPVVFEPRGRRQLKGLTEPIAIFSVRSVEEGADAWQAGARSAGQRRRRRRRIALGLAGLGLFGLVAAGAWLAFRPPPGLPPGPWVIGFDGPLTGEAADLAQWMLDATTMAVEDVNAAGGIGGSTLEIRAYDNLFDETAAASNADAMVADARVVSMVGAPQSFQAQPQIPITNTAGLLQCSPSASDPILTRPEYGALQLRAAQPDRINFIRAFGTNAMEGPAMATFARSDLSIDHVLVIVVPDERDDGRRIGDAFAAAFEGQGGEVTELTLNAGADPATVLEPLSTGDAEAVYAAAVFYEAAAELRQAMVDAGHGSLPFLTWETSVGPEYVELTGDGADGTFATRIAIPPAKASFVDRYRATYGVGFDEAQFGATAYACVEVIAEALRAVATSGASAEGLREAVRAVAVDQTRQVETVLGTMSFDENGDPVQQFVEIMRPDPSAGEDELGWEVEKAAQDYGPIP